MGEVFNPARTSPWKGEEIYPLHIALNLALNSFQSNRCSGSRRRHGQECPCRRRDTKFGEIQTETLQIPRDV